MPILVPSVDVVLCTVDEAKQQINKSGTYHGDDTELLAYCQAVVAPIEAEYGEFLPRTVTETYTPSSSVIVLRSERIVSVGSVVAYSGTSGQAYTGISSPADATSYNFTTDTTTGILRGGEWAGQTVLVTYVSGMAAVPPNVNLAARLVVANLWETQQGGAGLPDVYGTEAADPSNSGNSFDIPIPNRARMLLEPYRRAPRVA